MLKDLFSAMFRLSQGKVKELWPYEIERQKHTGESLTFFAETKRVLYQFVPFSGRLFCRSNKPDKKTAKHLMTGIIDSHTGIWNT